MLAGAAQVDGRADEDQQGLGALGRDQRLQEALGQVQVAAVGRRPAGVLGGDVDNAFARKWAELRANLAESEPTRQATLIALYRLTPTGDNGTFEAERISELPGRVRDAAVLPGDEPSPRIATVSGRCPPFYFGGLSEPARECAAAGADVYLMWPDRLEAVAATLDDMRRRAARHGRALRFGYRVHVIVRETESEARAAARALVSRLDTDTGEAIRRRSLDHASAGVRRQAEIREAADTEGYVGDHLWTGIGRARSGCGAAIVGDPDQVVAKLRAYVDLGIEAFILSGYPHADECDRFARTVLPELRAALATG